MSLVRLQQQLIHSARGWSSSLLLLFVLSMLNLSVQAVEHSFMKSEMAQASSEYEMHLAMGHTMADMSAGAQSDCETLCDRVLEHEEHNLAASPTIFVAIPSFLIRDDANHHTDVPARSIRLAHQIKPPPLQQQFCSYLI